MIFFKNKILILGLLLLFANTSFAADTSTVGDSMYQTISNVYLPLKILIGGISMLLGYFLIASGIIKLRDDQMRHGHGTTDAMLKILGGAALTGFSTILGVGINTVYQAATGNTSLLGTTPGGVSDCLSSGFACVAQNISENVVPVFVDSSFALAYVYGGFLIISQINLAAKSYSQGRPDIPKGFAYKMILGFLICNLPHLFTLFQSTLGVGSSTSVVEAGAGAFSMNYSQLQYTSATNDILKYVSLIQYLFKILVIFGIIAVWRGIHILKILAEGHQQQKTVSGAIVHIIAGVCLVNAKWATCTIVGTAWGAAILSSFCG